MEYKPPTSCPVCEHQLMIKNLSCKNCKTTLEGNFTPCKFCRLPSEQLEFLEVFIKCRGSIKDVEKELNISYPTVRNRLENLIQSLGYQAETKRDLEDEGKRMEILAMLENGEIDAQEARDQLKKLQLRR